MIETIAQVATIVATVGGAFAVYIAYHQFRAGSDAVKVQRVIDLHRDLTAGEVGAARSRFSSLMWKAGEAEAGCSRCHQFTWDEIRSPVLTTDGVVEQGRLGSYDSVPGVTGAQDAEPMRDLYAVLWCFERIEAGRSGGALDDTMLEKLIAPHAVWWDALTKDVEDDPMKTTIHLGSLRTLAGELCTDDLAEWASRDFDHR